MRGMRTTLLVAGILLASLAESSGPVWILAAAGSFASFAALLAIFLKQEVARSAGEREGRETLEVTMFRPPPAFLHGQDVDTGITSCMKPPGWACKDTALSASRRGQGCHGP